MSNTKLTKVEKALLKEEKRFLFENGGTIERWGQYTVVKCPEFPGSRMAKFFVSVCSPNEKKNRRKVGEYRALFSDRHLILPMPVSVQRFMYMLQDSETQDNGATYKKDFV